MLMLENKFHQMPQSQEENQFRSIVLSILIMQEIDQLSDIKQGLFYIVVQYQ